MQIVPLKKIQFNIIYIEPKFGNQIQIDQKRQQRCHYKTWQQMSVKPSVKN